MMIWKFLFFAFGFFFAITRNTLSHTHACHLLCASDTLSADRGKALSNQRLSNVLSWCVWGLNSKITLWHTLYWAVNVSCHWASENILVIYHIIPKSLNQWLFVNCTQPQTTPSTPLQSPPELRTSAIYTPKLPTTTYPSHVRSSVTTVMCSAAPHHLSLGHWHTTAVYYRFLIY